ncbi:MAG TPA: glycosyltransferase, partial [Beutenbergiaceae bacterium]|nr:glycosyltransferase [Beutenbergiaceae bacterium]
GAQKLNEVVPQVAEEITGAGAQVFHLTGQGKMIQAPQLPDYHVREYLVDMHHALACADVVIGRAGAGIVAELTALGIPAIYVPFPIGNGEQRLNAQDVVTAGGGIMVEDRHFSPSWLIHHITPLLTNASVREEMAQRAKRVGVVDAAQRLARIVMEVAG